MTIKFESALNEVNSYIEKTKNKGIEVLFEQDYYDPQKWKYRVPYQSDSIDFIHKVSAIPKSVIDQFLNLNILRYMVKGLPTDIYLDITLTKERFVIWFGNELYRHSIFRVFVSQSEGIEITYTYRNEKISEKFTYEDGYKAILKDINSNINPTLINTLNFLNVQNLSLQKIIQEKLKPYSIKYFSREDFCESCNQDKDQYYPAYNREYPNYSFEITTDVFQNFIKDKFLEETYKKILHLMNLLRFIAYVKGENVNEVVSITFPMFLSKYARYNDVFYFDFLSTTISLIDNGEFIYHDQERDEPVFLYEQDINIIYDYFLKELNQLMIPIINSSDEHLTMKDIEVHRMTIY